MDFLIEFPFDSFDFYRFMLDFLGLIVPLVWERALLRFKKSKLVVPLWEKARLSWSTFEEML